MLRIALLALTLFLASSASFAEKAPGFTLESDNGKVSLEDLKDKLIYVDFWATWCAPCRTSFPWMNEMNKKYKDKGLKILAINLDNKRGRVKTFLEKYPAEFTILYDPEGKTADDFKVKVMPSSYFINDKGEIVGNHFGFRSKDADALEQEIIKQLGL